MKSNIFKKIGYDSKFLTGQFPKFLYPLYSFVVFQHSLSSLEPKSDGCVYNIGIGVGKTTARQTLKEFKTKSNLAKLKQCLKEAESMGLGQGTITRFVPEKRQIVIKNENNNWAKQFKKTFSVQKDGVDPFLAGLYTGFLIQLFGPDHYIEETDCFATGGKYCSFQLVSKPPYRIRKDLHDSVLDEKNITTSMSKSDPNILIQKMFTQDHITLENGDLRIWTVRCMFLPIDMYHTLYNLLQPNSKQVENLYMYFGIINSKIGNQHLIDKFGLKNGKETFNNLLQQMEFFGLGKGELLDYTDKKGTVRFSHNFSVMQSSNMFGKNNLYPCHTIALLIGMFMYCFKKQVKSYSYRTNPVFEATFTLTKDEKQNIFTKTESKIDKKIRTTINEHMKHQYYLN